MGKFQNFVVYSSPQMLEITNIEFLQVLVQLKAFFTAVIPSLLRTREHASILSLFFKLKFFLFFFTCLDIL